MDKLTLPIGRKSCLELKLSEIELKARARGKLKEFESMSIEKSISFIEKIPTKYLDLYSKGYIGVSAIHFLADTPSNTAYKIIIFPIGRELLNSNFYKLISPFFKSS